jgi:hypothetical protein
VHEGFENLFLPNPTKPTRLEKRKDKGKGEMEGEETGRG